MQKSSKLRTLDDTELTQAKGKEAATPQASHARPLTGIYFIAPDGSIINVTQPQ